MARIGRTPARSVRSIMVAAALALLSVCWAPRALGQSGGRIVFSAATGDGGSTYLTTPVGGKFEELGGVAIAGGSPAWSPNGQMVALHHSRADAPTGIYVVGTDGGGLKEVSNGPWSYDPTWAPGGGQIAYSSTRAGVGLHSIYVADLRGGGEVQLTVSDTVAYHPSWSPSRNRIAYAQITDGASDIHVVDGQGRRLAQLTDDPNWDARPSWHPHGTAISFSSGGADDQHGDIYTINADGSDRRRLTAHPASDTSPIWSPDSRYILFMSMRDAKPANDGGDLFILGLDGRVRQKVTDERFMGVFGADWYDPAFPRSVSPVGRHATTWGWLKRVGARGR